MSRHHIFKLLPDEGLCLPVLTKNLGASLGIDTPINASWQLAFLRCSSKYCTDTYGDMGSCSLSGSVLFVQPATSVLQGQRQASRLNHLILSATTETKNGEKME